MDSTDQGSEADRMIAKLEHGTHPTRTSGMSPPNPRGLVHKITTASSGPTTVAASVASTALNPMLSPSK
jgi:hypothetical protein